MSATFVRKMLSAKLTLGKNERLKSRKDLEKIFSTGKNFHQPPFRVYYQYVENDNNDSSLQFGVGVSSRNFRKAVQRNRLKRLIRECWRLQKMDLAAHLDSEKRKMQVFVVYTGREMATYELLQKTMKSVLHKLQFPPAPKK